MPSAWYKCKDCGDTDFELFMVKNALWLKIWPRYIEQMTAIKDPKKRHGVLCMPCAEKRLGRKIRESDLIQGSNWWMDPAGVSEADGLEMNVNVEEILDKAPAELRKEACARYFLLKRSRLNKKDGENMAALVALGLPKYVVNCIYHIKSRV